MATWGLHIRIAERLLDREFDLDREGFLIGNIGPDCGMPNEDWSAFNPPSEISHWSRGGKENINTENFLEVHLNKRIEDRKEKSFLLGYYAHLLTDIEFSKFIRIKKENDKNYEKLKEDKKFIWTIKKDWYDLDHLYFRDNPTSLFYELFQHVKVFPDYLSYYPKGAITRQVKYITDFYLKSSDNLDREYTYLTSEEMNDFLEHAVKVIEEKLEVQIALA